MCQSTHAGMKGKPMKALRASTEPSLLSLLVLSNSLQLNHYQTANLIRTIVNSIDPNTYVRNNTIITRIVMLLVKEELESKQSLD